MVADVRLVAILDPSLLGGRDLATVARAVAAGGATALQLRMKRAGAREYAQAAAQLVAAVAPLPVYVNDRADVAWAAGAAGVHLGADDVSPASVRRQSPAPLLVGISVGSPMEAVSALQGPADYWSVGALYATQHKRDAGPPLGTTGFRALAASAPRGTPIVAIEGITAERVPEVMAAGAAGIAVIGAILETGDPEAATRRLRDAVDANRLR